MVSVIFLLLAGSVSFDESFRAGLTALQHNDLAAAALNLETSAKLAPANGRVWVALSQTYRKMGDRAKADQAAGKAVALAPKDPLVLENVELSYFEAAQPLLKEQKFAEAVAVLEPGDKLLPHSAQIALALGVADYGLRRFDAAAVCFLRTIAINPAIEQPYLFLGKFVDQVPDHLPEISRRLEEFQKAHPEDATANLLYARIARPEEAQRLIQKALSINENFAPAHYAMAGVFDRLGRFEDAAREYEKSAELDPSDPDTHYRLARDYDRLGRHDAAQQERDRHKALLKSEGGMN